MRSELRERGCEHYIVATDLDTTERRVFGEEDDMDMPDDETGEDLEDTLVQNSFKMPKSSSVAKDDILAQALPGYNL